jgi:hypothetical protein
MDSISQYRHRAGRQANDSFGDQDQEIGQPLDKDYTPHLIVFMGGINHDPVIL